MAGFGTTTYATEEAAEAALLNAVTTAGLTVGSGIGPFRHAIVVLASMFNDGPPKIIQPVAALGFGTGAGGAVTQATSKSTGVTLSKPCGQITMNGAALAAGVEVAFTLTNTLIAATDVVAVSIASGGTSASYLLAVTATAAGSCEITVSNCSGGSLSEALVLNFVVLKAVAA